MAIILQPDIITLDNMLPDMNGLDVLKAINKEEVNPTIIMISSLKQQSVIDKGINLGAKDYVIKPFTASGLMMQVNNACA
jgi:two-component system chemotaxis response regulator CheY